MRLRSSSTLIVVSLLAGLLSGCKATVEVTAATSNPPPTASPDNTPPTITAFSLLDFNEPGANSTVWPGWQWINGSDVNPHTAPAKGSDGFGSSGWDGNPGLMMSGNWYPRSEAKQDTGNYSLAIIDPNTHAPGTGTGGSAYVYDTPTGVATTGTVTAGSNIVTVADPTGYKVGDNIRMSGVNAYNYISNRWFPQIGAISGNQFTIIRSDTGAAYNADMTVSNCDFRELYLAGWWYNFGRNFNTLGLADSTTNRMSLYVKVVGIAPFIGTTDLDNMSFYVGTYLCWPGGATGGRDCPYEANATTSNHYYHYFTMNSGGWTHLLLDQSPQHNRGDSGAHIGPPDQRFVADGVHHYFQYMNNFYLQVSYPQQTPTSFWVDEITFYTAPQPENEISVASLFVSYLNSQGVWEIGFNDNSWSDAIGNSAISTYEIRYSTLPITNDNFNSATPITPIYNSKTGTNAGAGRISRPNPWKFSAWTQFNLPSSLMQSGRIIYFAVKDVSSAAAGDGHDAVSPLIKTIDYVLQ